MKYLFIKIKHEKFYWRPLKRIQRHFPMYLLWILAFLMIAGAGWKRLNSEFKNSAGGEMFTGECISVCSRIEACLKEKFPSEFLLYGRTLQSGCIVKCPKHIARVRNCVSVNDCGSMIPCYIKENH